MVKKTTKVAVLANNSLLYAAEDVGDKVRITDSECGIIEVRIEDWDEFVEMVNKVINVHE